MPDAISPGAASGGAIATRTRARVGSRPAKVRRIVEARIHSHRSAYRDVGARTHQLCNQVQRTILRLFSRFVVKGNGTRRDVTTNVTLLVPFLPALPFPSTFSGLRIRLDTRLAYCRSASRAVTAVKGWHVSCSD